MGKDIAAGLYWTDGGDGCYFERLKGFSGAIDDIIANGNPIGQVILLIDGSDAGFKSDGCGTWKNITSLPVRSDPTASFSDGIWKVKDQIAPGSWKTSGGESCYWERLKGFGGTLDDIIANDLPTGTAIVTISPSDQGFTTKGCGDWTKVGP